MIKNSLPESFRFAFEGIFHAFSENRNIRIHLAIGTLVLFASWLLGLNKIEKIIILFMTASVVGSEMINTSIEEMTNLITLEHKREAKIAKDVAAGMVLVASTCAAIVGFVIFAPYILKLF